MGHLLVICGRGQGAMSWRRGGGVHVCMPLTALCEHLVGGGPHWSASGVFLDLFLAFPNPVWVLGGPHWSATKTFYFYPLAFWPFPARCGFWGVVAVLECHLRVAQGQVMAQVGWINWLVWATRVVCLEYTLFGGFVLVYLKFP